MKTIETNRRPSFQIWSRALALVALLTFFGAADALGQFSWDRPRENLQVLPEDISPQQLRNMMVGFSRGLGVRCEYCHDDSQGNRLEQMDFGADVKEAKEIARVMIQMVRRINGEELAELRTAPSEVLQVTCVTCHRGQPKPQMLEDVLAEVIATEGVDAAVERYHALRERYKDGFTFDFREGVLNNLGYQLLGAGQVAEAIAIFKLNVEVHPEAWNAYDSLAEGYLTNGQPEVAAAYYQHSLVLNPENTNAVDMLKKIKE